MNTQSEPVVKLEKGYRKYRIKGIDRDIIARKGGPTARQIKTKASYKELRNNQKEFGAASSIAKTLRNTFSEDLAKICETYVSGKLTAKFRCLAKLEEGPTGTRPLYLTKHADELSGFEFNSSAPYGKIFGTKYYIKPGSERGHLILHFPSFIPDESFKKPKEATNFKVNARLVALSDFCFDKSEKEYRAVNKKLHGKFASFDSGMLPMLKMPMDPMTAQLNLMTDESTDGASMFLIMAVSFYHYENGQFHLLDKASGMQIKQVF